MTATGFLCLVICVAYVILYTTLKFKIVTQTTNPVEPLIVDDEPKEVVPDDNKQAERTRGFRLGRYRFRYLRASAPMGFAHDEIDVLAVTVFEIVTLMEHTRKAGYRIVLGSHSFWIFR